ncbi:MAG: RloB family protein [Anaerolineales bacterium]|jgi:hypothetical protein
MPREFNRRKRKSNLRESKLIAIATEGYRTEVTYFNALSSPRYYRNPRIHVEVLERVTTDSSPEYVLQMLDEFKREFKIRTYDELWMVIDYDRWGEKKISSIARLCEQKGYNLGLSKPCFELWLLLHLTSLDVYNDMQKEEFLRNQKVGNRSLLENEIVNLVGEYNRSRPNCDLFIPNIELAIERARNLDTNPEHRWPNELGTRVHLLAEKIIAETFDN